MAEDSDLILPPQHRLFALPAGETYLNCAYMSPNLNAVQNAGISGLKRKSEPWRLGVEMFFKECEELRELAGQLVGATANHIAITPAASYGIAVAARNLAPRLNKGENIVVLAEQFPSNYYAWDAIAKERGAEIRTIPTPDDHNWTAAILSHIDSKTRILALPNCHWTDGTVIDLHTIRQQIGEPGENTPYLVLDLTQSLGAYPFDARAIKPDFMAAAAYKWLMCPYGTGILYVAEHFWDGDPIEYNWVNRYRSEDLVRLVEYCDQYQPGARRFDVGERSNPVMLPMMVAAFRQLLDWRVDRIHATLTDLTDHLAANLADVPLACAAKEHRAGHMIGLYYERRLSDGLRAAMTEAGIHVSYRGAGMRVSPHLYNRKADVDTLLTFLADYAKS